MIPIVILIVGILIQEQMQMGILQHYIDILVMYHLVIHHIK